MTRRKRYRLAGILTGALVLCASEAVARENPAAACQSRLVATGKVAKILDGRSFALDDGREIRLAGIETPLLPAPNEQGPAAAAGLAAKAALESILMGRQVEFYQQASASDRYGRILAHVYLSPSPAQADNAGRSAGEILLAKGFARVTAAVGDTACAAELLAQERSARAGRLGLWGEQLYGILAADRLPELMAGRGRFELVEGRVVSVRQSGGTIYVNFGRRWSQALTVTISKRRERIFTAAGLEPKKLENRRLRVRGWVEERNGPRIEATRPEQIEIAELN